MKFPCKFIGVVRGMRPSLQMTAPVRGEDGLEDAHNNEGNSVHQRPRSADDDPEQGDVRLR